MPDVSDTRMKPEFSAEKAHKTQMKLSKRILFEDKLPRKIRFVGGVDTAYIRDISIGAAAVLDFPSLKLVESKVATCKTRFPYIPTLLSFREVPPSVLAIHKLSIQPDVFLVDGHGYAHPYRCGFASHLGLVMKKPTIGVAKGKLIGNLEHSKDNSKVVYIRHKGDIIGAMMTPKPERKPVYVSVGNMVSLETAIKIVKHCTMHNRIPEPIRVAHRVAAVEKRKINISTPTQTSSE
jgi:deoxyribonuclease V